MYITICEIDFQSRLDVWDRVLRAGALGWPWRMGWGGRWEGVQDGGHMYTCGWFMSMYGGNYYHKKRSIGELGKKQNTDTLQLKLLLLCFIMHRNNSAALLCVCKLLSRVQLFATPWTVAHQAPLSMRFSRQEYWSELPCLSTGDLPDPGIKAGSPALQADSSLSEPPGKP